MHTGISFLIEQVDDTIAKHATLVQSIVDHESQADDGRYRDLCARHAPRMREHQRMLESFRSYLGSTLSRAQDASVAGTVKPGARAFPNPHLLADSLQSDYERLSDDLSLARDLEVTFKTFRDGGRQLGIPGLAQLGEVAERHHDDYSAEAKRLLQQMFVERAHGAADAVRSVVDSRADIRG